MARVLILLSVVTLIGGLTPIAARMAVQELPPMTVAWVRFGGAGILLWLALRIRGLRPPFSRRDLPGLLGLGLLGVSVNQGGFLIGVKLSNASHAALFYALAPVLAFWISVGLRRAAFSVSMLVAAMLAFTGAACVIWPSFFGGPENAARPSTMFTGDLLLLVAVTSWAAFSVFSKPAIHRYGAMRTLAAVFLLGAVMQTPLALFDIGRVNFGGVTWKGLSGLAFMTVLTSFVNYLLWYNVLARYEPTRAMIVVNGGFLIAVLTEWLAFGEPLTGWFFAGCALIISAIGLDVLCGVRR